MKKIFALLTLVFLMAFSVVFAEERAPYVIELEILPGPTAASGVSPFYIEYDRDGTGAKSILSMPRAKGKSQVYQIDNATASGAAATFSVYTVWSNINDSAAWSGASPYYLWTTQLISGTTRYHKTIPDSVVPPMKFQKWYFVSGATPFTAFEMNMSTSD